MNVCAAEIGRCFMNKESAEYKASHKFGQDHPILILFGVLGFCALLAISFNALFGSSSSTTNPQAATQKPEEYAINFARRYTPGHIEILAKHSNQGEVLYIRCDDINGVERYGKLLFDDIQLQPGYTNGDHQCASIEIGIHHDKETQVEMHNAGFVWVTIESPNRKETFPVVSQKYNPE